MPKELGFYVRRCIESGRRVLIEVFMSEPEHVLYWRFEGGSEVFLVEDSPAENDTARFKYIKAIRSK